MAFNKLDDDSSLSLGGLHHSEFSAPIIDQDDDDDDDDDNDFFAYNQKDKQKTRHTETETQKTSGFVRRGKSKHKDITGDSKGGKKSRGGRSKSMKTPPESPRSKVAEVPMRSKAARGVGSGAGVSQVQPSPSGKGVKGNYATLLDNDFSSDDGPAVDEEDADNFLLSKGHLARERRAGTMTRATPSSNSSTTGDKDDVVIALNPMAVDESHLTGSDKSAFTSSYPPTVGMSQAQAFPVHFAPPTEARFPDPNTDSQVFQSHAPEPFSYTKPGVALSSPFTPSTQPVVIPSLPPPPLATTVPPSLPLPPSAAGPPSVITSSLPPPLPTATPLSHPPPSATAMATLPFPPPASCPLTDTATCTASSSSTTATTTSTFDTTQTTAPVSSLSPIDWSLSDDFRKKCSAQFADLKPEDGLLKGESARNFFLQSRLSIDDLSRIWKLSDGDQDGALTLHEFCVAMKLVLARRKGHDIPESLPDTLLLRRKHDPNRPVNPRLRFSIPPPPPSAAPSSSSNQPPPFQQSQSSKQFVPLEEKSESSTTQSSLLNRRSAPDLLDSIVQAHEKTSHSHQEQAKKSKKDGREEDERALMSESLSSERLASDEEDAVRKEKARKISLGFGFDLPTAEVKAKSATTDLPVGRLISLEDDVSQDTAVLVEEKRTRRRSSSLSDQAPKPKPRRKKTSPKVDRSSSSTEDTPTRKPAPPRPAPYQGRVQRSTSPVARSSSTDSFQETTPFISTKEQTSPLREDLSKPQPTKPARPPRTNEGPYSRHLDEDDHDGVGVDRIKAKKSKQRTLSPESGEDQFEKGHARNPSWGKMLKEEQALVLEDLPSAEPPKLPPRSARHILSPDPAELSPPPGQLSRSASTGSLASIGRGATLSSKSRSPSVEVESGSVLTAMELVTETTLIPKRPAPAPPVKPKPRKQPMYPPSFKRIEQGDQSEGELVQSFTQSVENRSGLVESYKKKTKIELQRSIKSLKDDNAMYTKMNQELHKILNELREEQTKLSVLLDQHR